MTEKDKLIEIDVTGENDSNEVLTKPEQVSLEVQLASEEIVGSNNSAKIVNLEKGNFEEILKILEKTKEFLNELEPNKITYFIDEIFEILIKINDLLSELSLKDSIKPSYINVLKDIINFISEIKEKFIGAGVLRKTLTKLNTFQFTIKANLYRYIEETEEKEIKDTIDRNARELTSEGINLGVDIGKIKKEVSKLMILKYKLLNDNGIHIVYEDNDEKKFLDVLHKFLKANNPQLSEEYKENKNTLVFFNKVVELTLDKIIENENNKNSSFYIEKIKFLDLLRVIATLDLGGIKFNKKNQKKYDDYLHNINTIENNITGRSLIDNTLKELNNTRKKYDATKENSYKDGLTNLRLKAVFEEDFKIKQRFIIRCSINKEEKKYCYILFDVNNFKYINDTFGHNAGDDFLEQIAKCIDETLSRPDDSNYRVGGDEFGSILYVENENILDGMKKITEKINQNLRLNPLIIEGPNGERWGVVGSVSSGGAFFENLNEQKTDKELEQNKKTTTNKGDENATISKFLGKGAEKRIIEVGEKNIPSTKILEDNLKIMLNYIDIPFNKHLLEKYPINFEDESKQEEEIQKHQINLTKSKEDIAFIKAALEITHYDYFKFDKETDIYFLFKLAQTIKNNKLDKIIINHNTSLTINDSIIFNTGETLLITEKIKKNAIEAMTKKADEGIR